MHFLRKTSHRDVNAGILSKTWLRAFSDPLEHLVTIASVLLLPYKFKNIFKRRIFSKPR